MAKRRSNVSERKVFTGPFVRTGTLGNARIALRPPVSRPAVVQTLIEEAVEISQTLSDDNRSSSEVEDSSIADDLPTEARCRVS